jgi:hypothetical protein
MRRTMTLRASTPCRSNRGRRRIIRQVQTVVNAFLRAKDARRATKFMSPTLLLRATGVRGRLNAKHVDIVLTIRAPKARDRYFIKAMQRAGEPFSVCKIRQGTLAGSKQAKGRWHGRGTKAPAMPMNQPMPNGPMPYQSGMLYRGDLRGRVQAGMAVTGWKRRESSAAPVSEIRDGGREDQEPRQRGPGESL